MNDQIHKDGLYRWKRQTDNRVYSRAQQRREKKEKERKYHSDSDFEQSMKVTTNDDIQDWIQKVEAASNSAAEKVFGSSYTSGRTKGKVASLSSVKQLREHDAALSEAQELLSQWMDEKVHLSDNVDEEYIKGSYHQRAVQSDVKKEWDNLLDNNYEEFGLKRSTPRPTINDTDPYAYLEHMDDSKAVDSILQHMLNKKVVKDEFSQDLGLDEMSKHKDPRTKMELRHKQVKENREKREKELEKKRRDLQSKKDAHHRAKQMILQEERNKISQAKKEEMEIRKEMTKIRKEMQEQRHLVEESKQREKREREAVMMQAKKQVNREEELESARQAEKQRQEDERRRRVMLKLGEIQTRQEAANLKCLQKHFSAWYNVVLERRLQLGKAKALYDWKLLLHGWNAWKSFVRSRKIDLETKQHEISVIQTHRKNQAAESHYRVSLLRKYFVAWQLWVKQEQERQEMERAQEKTRNKMVALLEAAATGKLWGSDNNVKAEQKPKPLQTPVTIATSDVDAFFEDQPRRPLTTRSDLDLSTDRSSSSTNKKALQRNKIPTQAWQVTKKHINLTKEEIASLGGGAEGEVMEHSDQNIRQRFGTQPWMNRKYIPDSFQNRHAAQQKILQEQQKQLKEQQRLIEELQFKQTQQQNAHDIATQQMILEKLSAQDFTLPRQQNDNRPVQQDSSVTNEERLNNKSYIQSPPKQVQQKLNQVKVKDTNVAMETARTEATSDVSGAASNVTMETSRTGHNKYLSVLKTMEDRAAERARLKAEREEKRRKAEDERLERLKAEEEMLKKREEEEKRARAAAYREKKRLEKEKEQQKQLQIERMKELTAKADAHYLRSIMKYRGLLPFKRLVTMAKENNKKALNHYKQELKRKTFKEWFTNVQDIVKEKQRLADQMYSYLIVKHYFHNWRLFKHHTTIMEGRAKRFYQRNLKNKILLAWYNVTAEEKIASVEKDKMAGEHYLRSLLKKTFTKWHDHPQEVKREQEREKRRADMRKKVAMLLPDYELHASVQHSKDDLS